MKSNFSQFKELSNTILCRGRFLVRLVWPAARHLWDLGTSWAKTRTIDRDPDCRNCSGVPVLGLQSGLGFANSNFRTEVDPDLGRMMRGVPPRKVWTWGCRWGQSTSSAPTGQSQCFRVWFHSRSKINLPLKIYCSNRCFMLSLWFHLRYEINLTLISHYCRRRLMWSL